MGCIRIGKVTTPLVFIPARMDQVVQKVSLHKSMLRSALSVRMDLSLAGIITPTEDGVRLSASKP